MQDKLKKALVLFFIGVISGLSIWFINSVTADRIDDNVLGREEGFYKEIFEIDESVSISFTETEVEDGLFEIEITSEGNVVGYIYKGIKNNNYGNITVLVGVDNGEIVNVLISESSNTPNFVKKIENGYLEPFMGQDTENVTFDSKTGASYTYGSVEEVVTEATDYYNTERGAE